MNLYYKRLDIAFVIGLLGILLMPGAKLLYFTPFIIILYYKRSFFGALLGSLFCGVVVDLLLSSSMLGIYAINFTLVSAVLYRLRYSFFPDSLGTLPLLTFLFGMLSALVDLVLMFLFDHPVTIGFQWVLSDLCFLPTLDALYAFTVFCLPSLIFGKRQMRGTDYFTSR